MRGERARSWERVRGLIAGWPFSAWGGGFGYEGIRGGGGGGGL